MLDQVFCRAVKVSQGTDSREQGLNPGLKD